MHVPIMYPSVVYHSEHFKFLHSKLISVGCSRKHFVALLTVDVLIRTLTVVRVRKVAIAVFGVAAVIQTYVLRRLSKCKLTFRSVNKFVVAERHHFFHGVHLQQKGASLRVIDVTSLRFPLVMSVGSDCFTEVGSYQHKGVFDVIALLMKLIHFEVVL